MLTQQEFENLKPGDKVKIVNHVGLNYLEYYGGTIVTVYEVSKFTNWIAVTIDSQEQSKPTIVLVVPKDHIDSIVTDKKVPKLEIPAAFEEFYDLNSHMTFLVNLRHIYCVQSYDDDLIRDDKSIIRVVGLEEPIFSEFTYEQVARILRRVYQ